MNEQDTIVLEGTENTAPAAEETEVQVEQEDGLEVQQDVTADESAEKLYTEAELNQRVDELLGKKIARREAKIHKDYQKKYGELENVLRAGTGKDKIEDITDSFKQFYQEKGITIPAQTRYSDRDIEVLARSEAEDIINSGMDEVIEEVDRLAGIGAANMSPREKEVFRRLAQYRKNTERNLELEKIGVGKDVYSGSDFQEFAKKFDPSTPITEVFAIYSKMQPQTQIQTAGSMKNTGKKEEAVKDFYTVEEARKFTKKDFDRNPKLFEAVERSMTKW